MAECNETQQPIAASLAMPANQESSRQAVPSESAGQRTSISSHLHYHKVDKVNKGAAYKCARCPAAYKMLNALRVHTGRHDGVRRLQCDYCPAKFFSHSVLSMHKRTHTGEKPYVCKICSKGFPANHHLKTHMKVHGIFSVIKKDSVAENISDIFKENKA